MAKYLTFKEYGTMNRQKNLKTYGYESPFGRSLQNYNMFMEFLKHLEEYKEEFKDQIPYFWGMRKNWFPLVLLGAVKMGNTEALDLFNKMVKDGKCHSFYYKYLQSAPEEPFGLGGGDYDVVVISGIDKYEPYLKIIIDFFGLDACLLNSLDGLYADGGF